ncbi:tripartite tricarboxylate transporter TctB family protein [Parvibium lacunae]|uniref:Tripartite tricarboxylate transporter TctB family protein n=1 Tax=Parvibium lacunae TaxID=1888893 RepID=A0A368L0A9_9BURK|nr:tripartite tricarboxylate transporter TctB family protein [Parvibium lacunae]RCS56509.1 tripartite tricarboxylate transporter TctB family protein [Parvibium lacunae]
MSSVSSRVLKSKRDFMSGLFFIGLAAFGVYHSGQYDMGTAARMGPGYFPMMLSIGLGLLGMVILVGSFLSADKGDDGELETFHWKPLIIILGAIILFGALLKPLGLILSLLVLIIVSSLGSAERQFKEILLSCAALAIFAWLVFIKGLGLVIPVWPAFIS